MFVGGLFAGVKIKTRIIDDNLAIYIYIYHSYIECRDDNHTVAG